MKVLLDYVFLVIGRLRMSKRRSQNLIKWYLDLLLKYKIPTFQKMQEAEDELRKKNNEQEDQPKTD